jgi:hypothetical protein
MLIQTEAQILLNEYRGVAQTADMTRFFCFNYGEYYEESRQAFGHIRALNEEVLAPEKILEIQLLADTQVIILPLAGGVAIAVEGEPELCIAAGEVHIFEAKKDSHYVLTNPYSDHTVSLLHGWFFPESQYHQSLIKSTTTLDFSLKNTLLPIGIGISECFQIGQYDGRQSGELSLQPTTKGVFAFVIAGVFEVQDRLLHAKDGLLLWNFGTPTVEFEALSNDAILLVIETTFSR